MRILPVGADQPVTAKSQVWSHGGSTFFSSKKMPHLGRNSRPGEPDPYAIIISQKMYCLVRLEMDLSFHFHELCSLSPKFTDVEGFELIVELMFY